MSKVVDAKIFKRNSSKAVHSYLAPSGPNFIELFKHKILLKQKNPCLAKLIYRPKLHSTVMLSKQQLNTSHKQCIWHEILVCNMCKISKLFSCLSKFFCLSSSMKLAPGSNEPLLRFSAKLKTLDTIGNCQRRVFSLAVSQHMHKITHR